MKAIKIYSWSNTGDCFHLYVEHEVSNEVINKQEKQPDPDHTLFLGEMADGSYCYGLTAWGHERGHIWSSRASVMNREFGTNLIDVILQDAVSNYTYWRALDINIVKGLLPADFTIIKDAFSDGEEFYRIVYTGKENMNKTGVVWEA